MLKPECLEFQRTYEPGRGSDHADACPDCRSFAELVDGLGRLGMNARLGHQLRARLRDLPENEERQALAPPRVPMLPLPAALERQLRRIARAGQIPELPIWIRNPRFAIAASYLLTVLIGATVGNPAALAQEAAARFDRIGIAVESVEAGSRKSWRGVEEKAAEGLALTREFYRTSKSSIKSRWQEFVESLNDPETTDESEAEEAEPPSS